EAQRELVKRASSSSVSMLESVAHNRKAGVESRVAAAFGHSQNTAREQNLRPASSPSSDADALVDIASVRAFYTPFKEKPGKKEPDALDIPDIAPDAYIIPSDIFLKMSLATVVSHAFSERKGDAGFLRGYKTWTQGTEDAVFDHTLARCMARKADAKKLLQMLDGGSTASQLHITFRALAMMHQPEVVTGLIERLAKATDPALRQGILAALRRLHFQAWSETPKIAAALKDALAKASPEEAAFLVKEMNRNRIQSSDALERILVLAKQDAKVIPDAVAQLATAETIPADGIPLLITAANSKDLDPQSAATTLANTLTAIAKTDSAEAWTAALNALVTLDAQQGSGKEQDTGRTAFLTAPKLENVHQAFENEATKVGTPTAAWAEAALLSLAARKTGSPEAREMSQKALDAGWADAKRRVQIINAASKTKSHVVDDKILAATSDSDAQVAKAAQNAVKSLKIEAKGEDKTPKVGTLKPEDALAAVLKTKGSIAIGEQIFTKATCIACHTTKESEAQKGPYLGNIAQTYKRPELAQNILDPNKTIAQGFASEVVTLNDGTQQMGFITLESADNVKLRNVAAQEFTYAVKDIKSRQKLPVSIMPPGLMANFTVHEFASLLDYLESLVKK
ncbi:MAG: hypothetical protein B7Z37_28155, partial [Verrucomicrobia bacterium 12-59-8]